MTQESEKDINEIKQLLFVILVVAMCDLALKVCPEVVGLLCEVL